MLLGAAKHLAETRNFDGTVYFCFQPAEEGGGFFDPPAGAEPASEAAYSPPAEPQSVENVVNAAIAESALLVGESEGIPAEESPESEAEIFGDVPEGESFDDADGDMHETWDDDDDAFNYDGDVHETWDD